MIKLFLLKFKDVFYSLEISETDKLQEGLEIYRRTAPDMILLDGELPDSTFQTTLEAIPEFSENSAVIVLTNHERVEYVVAAMKNGAKDFMNKKMLANGKEFIQSLTKAWTRFEEQKIKETNKLPTLRIKTVGEELLNLAEQNMSKEDLRALIEFSNYARANFEEHQKKINKLYSAMFENNGVPSIKTQIDNIRRDQEVILNKMLEDQDDEDKANEQRDVLIAEKGKIKMTGRYALWGIALTGVATIFGAIINKVISWLFPHIP